VHIDQCITGNMATTDVGALKIDLTSAVIFVVNKDLYIYITIQSSFTPPDLCIHTMSLLNCQIRSIYELQITVQLESEGCYK